MRTDNRPHWVYRCYDSAGRTRLRRHAVSYADTDTISRTIAQAWHTPATAGDFRADASIQTPDVVSVVKVVR